MNLTRPLLIVMTAILLFWGCSTSKRIARRLLSSTLAWATNTFRGDPTSALRELLEAQKFNPQDANMHYALGRAYSAKGRFPQALASYRRNPAPRSQLHRSAQCHRVHSPRSGPVGCGDRRIRNGFQGPSLSDALLPSEQHGLCVLQKRRSAPGH